MELWKLTARNLPGPGQTLSECWCARQPYKQQTVDLKRSIEQAALNGVPLHVYVRIASCVKIDWNTLDRLQIISLLRPAKALWGKFAPMNLLAETRSRRWDAVYDRRLAGMKKAGYDPLAGDAWLGGMDTYQLFIPGLKREDVRLVCECDATKMEAIKTMLNISNLPTAGQLDWRRR